MYLRSFLRGWLVICLFTALGFPAVMQTEEEDPCAPYTRAGVEPLTFFVGQGDAFFAEGNYSRAIILYTCAIETDSTFVPAYVNRGYAHTVQGNFDLALADYEAALELDELYIPAYNNRGLLYTQQGRFGLALTDFDLVLTLDPDYITAYNNRGAVHAIEGNYALAIADFEQAIALDADFATPYASLGMVYSAMSVASYQTYREIIGNPATRLPAGDADNVINALDESRINGNYSIWLALLTPAP